MEQYARAQEDDDRTKINHKLWSEFGVEQAGLVLDMAEFSRLPKMRGRIHYLSMVQRMRMTARPIVENNGGHVVKFEADNCYARFPEVLDDVRAART